MKRSITITLILLIAMILGLSKIKINTAVTKNEAATSKYQNLEVKYDLSFFKPY